MRSVEEQFLLQNVHVVVIVCKLYDRTFGARNRHTSAVVQLGRVPAGVQA